MEKIFLGRNDGATEAGEEAGAMPGGKVGVVAAWDELAATVEHK